MTIEFNCPHCQKLLRTADDKAGSAAKCPQCGERISVPAPEEEFDPPGDEQFASSSEDEFLSGIEEFADEDSAGLPPMTSGRQETKTCPMCGQKIRVAAIKCRYCGEDLGGASGGGVWTPTTIDAGDVISKAWRVFTPQMGLCVGAFLVVAAVNIVASIPANVVNSEMERQRNGGEFAALFILFCGLNFLSFLVQWYIATGHCIFMLKIVRGEPAQISDLFTGGRFYLRMVGNSIIFVILSALGFAACFFPGVIVMLMFWPYVYALVDTDAPGLDVLTRAKEITSGNWGSVFLLWLASIGIAIAGVMALCVGLFVALPFISLIFAVAYCAMTGQRTAAD